MVSIVDVTGSLLRGAGVGHVSTDVHVLDIFVGVDLAYFFYNFCDGGRFLK